MNLRRAIWKYPLPPGPSIQVMPEGAEILSAGYVAGDVCVWAMVEPPTTPNGVDRKIYVAMTGEHVHVTHLGKFIGTVVCPNGIVAHIFEDLS